MVDKVGITRTNKTHEKERLKTKQTCSARFKIGNSVCQKIYCFLHCRGEKTPRNSTGEHTPIHDNSTSEQRENISIDLQSTQQSSSEIRESVVKKKSNVKALVSETMLEVKNEIESEIKQEIVTEMKKFFEESIKNKVKVKFRKR